MARDIMRRIDTIIETTDSEEEREDYYQRLRDEIEEAKKSTFQAKRELRMPGTAGIRFKGAIKYLLRLAGLMK
jgi:hypothetical protein